MRRASGAFKNLRNMTFHAHITAESIRIHFLRRRMKDRRNAFLFQQRTVRRKSARVLFVILARRKLHGIDKNRGDDDIRRLFCRAHQRHMPLMQRAHRRAESDRFARTFCRPAKLLHLFYLRKHLKLHSHTTSFL